MPPRNLTITLKESARRQSAPPIKRGPLPGRDEPEYLPRRLSTLCAWSRSWNVQYETYRRWTATVIGTDYIYNGTDFDLTVTDISTGVGETLNLNRGYYGDSPTETVETFDPNAIPMDGAVSITVDRDTGANTVITPFGTYSVTTSLVGGFWFARAQFRNYYVAIRIHPDVLPGTTPTCTGTGEPSYAFTFPDVFGITRDGTDITFEDINVRQSNTQLFDSIHGTYTPPIPSPCDSADAQAELARQSLEDQLETYTHVRDITFTPI